jgi:hypothetical protein
MRMRIAAPPVYVDKILKGPSLLTFRWRRIGVCRIRYKAGDFVERPYASASQLSVCLSAPHAAVCAACHGVRSQPVPVALVGECSIPLV